MGVLKIPQMRSSVQPLGEVVEGEGQKNRIWTAILMGRGSLFPSTHSHWLPSSRAL